MGMNIFAKLGSIPGAVSKCKGIVGGVATNMVLNTPFMEASSAGLRKAIEAGGGAKLSAGGKGQFRSASTSVDAPVADALEVYDAMQD